MAGKRAEGLSPCYMSMASPDIPDSHVFRWTFRGENSSDDQSKYTIRILDSDKNLVKTYTQSSGETVIPFEQVGYSFSVGETYYWSVTTYNKWGVASEPSVNAKFFYERCPAAPSITWQHIPKAGDVIVSDTYFAEIKNNIALLLNDYEDVPNFLYRNVNNLFDGDVIPTRQDFLTLESVVNFLSNDLEGVKSLDVDGPVEDSLGISDIEKIRLHIDMLMTVSPDPVRDLSIVVDQPDMYSVYGIIVNNDGKLDPTQDISWSVEDIPSHYGRVYFGKKPKNKDVRYYECQFQYGAVFDSFVSTIYFPADYIEDGSSFSFDTNWDGLYDTRTIRTARQSFQVTTIDQRGNRSATEKVTKGYGYNFKAPLGVADYEVEMQRAPSGDTSPDPNGRWSRVYLGSKDRITYRISGGEGRLYFRVKAIDKSGLETGWEYGSGVTFDPLTPPDTPRNFRAKEIGTNFVTLDWDSMTRAEEYQVMKWITPGEEVYRGAKSYARADDLASAHSYNFYVRAGNRVGWSKWATITVRTKTARVTKEKQATKGRSWRNNWGWDTSSDVHQGEWCEIAGSPNRIYSVPVGYCWGKWKGMWLFDDDYWRDTLKGKKIIKAELYIHRKGKAHGYYNDQIPTFWLHNHDSYPKDMPELFAKFKPGKEFDLDEKAWVRIPNYYAEYIRDGKAKGIGIYRENWGQLPYIKYYQNAKLRITYE